MTGRIFIFIAALSACPAFASNINCWEKPTVEKVLAEEAIGGVRVGMSPKEVILALGEPANKSKTQKRQRPPRLLYEKKTFYSLF